LAWFLSWHDRLSYGLPMCLFRGLFLEEFEAMEMVFGTLSECIFTIRLMYFELRTPDYLMAIEFLTFGFFSIVWFCLFLSQQAQ